MYRAIRSFTDCRTNHYYVPGDTVTGDTVWLEQLRKMGLVEKIVRTRRRDTQED